MKWLDMGQKSTSPFQVFKSCCQSVCILASAGLTLLCILQYSENRDASSIQFKIYHETEEDIYPSPTLCFEDYLDRNVFDSNTSLMNRYKSFLNGEEEENEDLANISYKDAIIDISDFIIFAYVMESKASNKENESKGSKTKNTASHTKRAKRDDHEGNDVSIFGSSREMTPTMVDGTDTSEKCWTFHIPFVKGINIARAGFSMKKSIFQKEKGAARLGFKVIFSYPGQTLKARVMKDQWKKTPYGNFAMVFNIQNMVVLIKRNKPHQPCEMDRARDDIRQRDLLIKNLGCRPAFVTSPSNWPRCNNWNHFKNCRWDDDYVEACTQVEKIFYTYEEYDKGDASGMEGGFFDLKFNFQGKTYMEIEQTRDYDLQSLIGNAGGYVGLFLGVCLLQLPQLSLDAYSFLRASLDMISKS